MKGTIFNFMVFFCMLAILTFGFFGDVIAEDNFVKNNEVASIICNVIKFVHGLGLPIMTAVIIGSSVMAIFGRLAWPAIMVLVVFTGIFFGAGKVVSTFVSNISSINAQGCPS